MCFSKLLKSNQTTLKLFPNDLNTSGNCILLHGKSMSICFDKCNKKLLSELEINWKMKHNEKTSLAIEVFDP